MSNCVCNKAEIKSTGGDNERAQADDEEEEWDRESEAKVNDAEDEWDMMRMFGGDV
ncbi:hypothetical protein JD969_07765 [Planctomycetota bacterium]|nr:hypothetical protein JD969_07765 [Planctomycetota bacterium]